MSRFVRPDTVRLEISQGDWLLVKKRLTAGEERQAFARMMRPYRTSLSGMPNGSDQVELDPVQATLSNTIAYLLDWSLVDDDGKPVVIRNQPVDVVRAALDALDLESFTEITQAIAAHEA